MKRVRVLISILFLCLIACSTVSAKESEGVIITHFAAHAGTSYAITHTTKVICDRAFQSDWGCLIAGAAISAGMGALKEYVLDEGGNHTRAWIGNGAGIALATALIMIDF